MKKNILIITGSPRDNGNSTELSKYFAKGAQNKGHQVTIFNAAKNKINPCVNCDNCWKKGKACSFDNDHFNELSEYIESSDVVVFSTPLYWFTFSAQIKSVIDKLYSYCVPSCNKSIKNKESILLCSAGDPNNAVFNSLLLTFKDINNYLGWTVKDTLLVGGVFNVGDINTNTALNKAESLGYCL
ncbi:flavodoxin family protein [Tepidibacter hydrothermalis]|uniref:Flavodoxin family protein n=1 Tax=Tepidibacter hydrothermalis TaxID=3036126 RepID=A0ABY8EG19_9FIRM|nr:flavodoxin family protein [Tepidibacter hydrothermalis]WFD11904.1 flavodoxin family protein [Tepidibacter hydrothermalis]